jgi:hypothetical protein
LTRREIRRQRLLKRDERPNRQALAENSHSFMAHIRSKGIFIMSTKSTIGSTAIVLGTFLLATGSMISYGESQSEWLQKQLQITDGYVPEPLASAPRNVTKRSPNEGTSATVSAGTADRANKKDQAGKSATQSRMQFLGDERMFASDGG